MTMASSASAVRFRAATPADDAWLAGRLPADRGRGVTFVGERDGARVATFAVAPPLERYEPEGLAVAFSVEPRPDARAVAEQVVALAARMAERANVGPLHAWPPPVEGTPGERAYRALGFEPFDRIVTWTCDAAAARDALVPLLEPARAWAPDDVAWRAVDTPLGDVDADAAADFYEAHLARLGPTRPAFLDRLRGRGPDAFHPTRSRALVLGGTLIGLTLVEFDPRVTRIAANIVAPPFRDGPASIRLLAATSTAEPIPPGCQLRFETHDRHRATVSLGRRLKATVAEARVKMRRS